MSTNKSKLTVLRVTQLDTEQIDNGVYHILSSEIKRSLQNKPFDILLNLEPEINAIIRFILWKFSVNKLNATVGQLMLGTEYHQSNRVKYLIFTVLVAWIQDRQQTFVKLLELFLNYNNKSSIIPIFEKIVTNIEITVHLASFVNFLLFLTYGKYINVYERLFDLTHMYKSIPAPRYIDYDYMRKEMIWESITQTIVCVLPFINTRKLINTGKKIVRFIQGDEYDMVIDFKCGICLQQATNPYTGSCNHIFCYYCIRGNMVVDNSFNCPKCGEIISHVHPTEFNKTY